MKLFSNSEKNKKLILGTFNKDDVIQEILENKSENCPGWNFFKIWIGGNYDPLLERRIDQNGFNEINGDFIAIYTDVINKEIRLKSNPFSEYTKVVESIYQIVREVYITDKDHDNEYHNIYKKIKAKSAKELFIKLKKEQE